MIMHLDLSGHCIETELKRQHNQAVAAYFKADKEEAARLEQIIETTRLALEVLDFPGLRAEDPELAGGATKPVTISTDDAGFVISTANGTYSIGADGA